MRAEKADRGKMQRISRVGARQVAVAPGLFKCPPIRSSGGEIEL